MYDEEINSFKALMPDKKGQAGKDITIYACENPNFRTRDWSRILDNINKKLIEADIPPGPMAIGSQAHPEKQINNCNYITYRYKDESKEKRKNDNKTPVSIVGRKTSAEKDKYGWPESDFVKKIAVTPYPSVNNQNITETASEIRNKSNSGI